MKRDVLIPSQLPGALASVPLPNNMEVSVLFTQYPGYVSYTITLNPNGIPLPAAGAVCLSWAIGLPGIYIDSTHQCNFPGSPSCLGGVPTNPCADRGTLNLTDTCNPIEYLSGSMSLQGASYSVATPIVSINSTNLEIDSGASNSISGHSVLIAYSYYSNGTGSALEQALRCSNVYMGNGTLNNFTYSGNGQQQSGPANGTITISTNGASRLLLEMLCPFTAFLVALLFLIK
ncbi:hypothetical protein VKS41_004826 [Umbelopsis sp. WA50703]